MLAAIHIYGFFFQSANFSRFLSRPFLIILSYLMVAEAYDRGYYMAARGYEFYLPVLKVSLMSERSERVRDTSAREDKIRIPKRPCNVLFIL